MTARPQIYALMLLGVTTLLLLLTAVCWHFSNEQSTALAQQRNEFLLQSLKKAAEDFLATGMTPEQMPAMQDVIDREKSSFPQLIAIDIFSPAGLINYSTDIGALGTQVPPSWLEQLSQPGTWSVQDATRNQLVMRFENDLGRAASGIVLSLQTTQAPGTLTQWQHTGRQALSWLGLLFGCGLAVWALTLWALRRSLRPYQYIHLILNQAPSAPLVSKASPELQRQAMQAVQKLSRDYAQTQQTMHRLQELDHGQ